MRQFGRNSSKVTVQSKGRIPLSHFNQLVIQGESRTDERFQKCRWDTISISASQLTRCIFEDVHARSANFGGGPSRSIYTDCTFDRCDFTFGAIGNARFVHCTFTNCRLYHLLGTEFEMIDCAFPETRIEKAVFHGTSHSTTPGSSTRTTNEFLRNDFSTAEFVDVGFRGGIDLSKQVLPNGRDYVYFADTCRAAEVAREIAKLNPGSVDAKQAESIQRLLEFHHSNGQKQMLIRLTGQELLAEQFRARLV